jgi:hypothetical protein
VNVAIPEEFVTALRVLVDAEMPAVGPLCSKIETVSPATGLPPASSTVTDAVVLAPALVSVGSPEKNSLLARPVVEMGTDDPHAQLETVMPDPHHTEHKF